MTNEYDFSQAQENIISCLGLILARARKVLVMINQKLYAVLCNLERDIANQ